MEEENKLIHWINFPSNKKFQSDSQMSLKQKTKRVITNKCSFNHKMFPDNDRILNEEFDRCD